jgi:hypothetical protein
MTYTIGKLFHCFKKKIVIAIWSNSYVMWRSFFLPVHARMGFPSSKNKASGVKRDCRSYGLFLTTGPPIWSQTDGGGNKDGRALVFLLLILRLKTAFPYSTRIPCHYVTEDVFIVNMTIFYSKTTERYLAVSPVSRKHYIHHQAIISQLYNFCLKLFWTDENILQCSQNIF